MRKGSDYVVSVMNEERVGLCSGVMNEERVGLCSGVMNEERVGLCSGAMNGKGSDYVVVS